MLNNSNILVIGGGVGPEAGTLFHQKIINMTDNQGLNDQGHANVLHASFSQLINDRTKYLIKKEGPNPGQSMAQMLKNTIQGHAKFGSIFVVGVPCNTFHSDRVYGTFTEELSDPAIFHLNMIQLTTTYFKKRFSNKKIILLSTRGTKETGVYSYIFEQNFKDAFKECEEPGMVEVMDAIYNPETGIKGQNPDYQAAVEKFESAIQGVVQVSNPSEYCVIMGCTEIPIAYNHVRRTGTFNFINKIPAENYVDPMDILAANMVATGGYKLKPQYQKYVVVDPIEDSRYRRLMSKL